MKPETVEKLHSQSPEFQELRNHLAMKLHELRYIPDVVSFNEREMAIEIAARQLAYNKLHEILEPLINPQLSTQGSAFDKREYQV